MSAGFASAGFDAVGCAPGSFEAVDAAIEAGANAAFAFLERLVREPSTVGHEAGAPFTPRTANGWMVGRGTGDMKGGVAMGMLALGALRTAMPDAVAGELSFLSVIEEECTGNGTLAAGRAGVLGNAVVLLEPTSLDLLLGGVGVL